MARIRWNNDLRPVGFVAAAFCLLILPLRWVFGWIAAVAVHEGCHLAALRLCGGKTEQIRFSITGAVIHAEALGTGKELFCVLAGPLGAVAILLPLAKVFPATAVCAFFQSLYNLLPLAKLDGGRALRCALALLLPPDPAQLIFNALQGLCLLLLVLGALYACIGLKLGVMPLIFAICLVMKGKFGKIP